MFYLLKALSLIILFASLVSCGHHFLSDQYINEINSKQGLWKAGRNFDPQTPASVLRGLLGVKKQPKPDVDPVKHQLNKNVMIPEFFDARNNWPECDSLRRIYDQSGCGSCWTVSVASAATDRLCIRSNGTDQRKVSAANVMSCCSKNCGSGCQGGLPIAAWRYWESGIVTGGAYNSSEGCQDYPFAPCRHHYSPELRTDYPNCPADYNEAPKCKQTCDDSSLNFQEELTYAEKAYNVKSDAIGEVEYEILTYGPIVAEFSVFEDFYSYKSGIYRRTSDNYVGEHAVRVLGWGAENYVPYWIVANSWNEEWGDNGTFKIIRNNDECGFEGSFTAGIPKL